MLDEKLTVLGGGYIILCYEMLIGVMAEYL
jgi:hypothetical protein